MDLRKIIFVWCKNTSLVFAELRRTAFSVPRTLVSWGPVQMIKKIWNILIGTSGQARGTSYALYILYLTLLFLPGCSLARNLSTIGEPPQMTQIKDPRDVPGYEPIHMPMPEPTCAAEKSTNSLWQTGSRAFFKDQRACKVGDVLTVEVLVDRKQYMQMNPDIERESGLSTTVTELLGQALPVQKRMAKALPGQKNSAPKPLTTWADVKSKPTHKSTAKYDVQDKMQFNMAAVVIQILPNGNMVIQGREEVRLVNELREIEIKGVIRREDISSNNTVASQKIAQLRISYGGRGDLSDVQQAPWGHQYLNKLLPF